MSQVASIEQLQTTLRPVLERHQVRKAIAVKSDNEAVNWNVFVVGNFRAKMLALASDVKAVIEDVSLSQIESELMVDSQILKNGVLFFGN